MYLAFLQENTQYLGHCFSYCHNNKGNPLLTVALLPIDDVRAPPFPVDRCATIGNHTNKGGNWPMPP